MKSIHQLVDTIVHGDAISNDCLQIQDFLRSQGFHSEIYARTSLIRTRHINNFKDMPEDADFIFHHSTITPLISFIKDRSRMKKALIYHNITPGAFFKKYNYQLFKLFHEAERQNYMLSQIPFEGIVGDSKYNLELIKDFIQAPYEAVIPPFLSLQFKKNDDNLPRVEKKKPFTILFVGRFAPNKKQSDLIKVFEYYSKFLSPTARLYLLGFYAPTDPYFNELYSFIQKRDIKNVFIRANLTSEELALAYKQSDLLLSMSEHEGFCIPILESIYFDVPVLAYKISALEELLEDEYLFDRKDYKKIAERIYEVECNTKLRHEMIQDQKKVFDLFKEEDIKEKFITFINTVFHV